MANPFYIQNSYQTQRLPPWKPMCKQQLSFKLPLGNLACGKNLARTQATPLYPLRAQVFIRVWKDGFPNCQLQPLWKVSLSVLMSSSTSIKFPVSPAESIIPELRHGRSQLNQWNDKMILHIPASWKISIFSFESIFFSQISSLLFLSFFFFTYSHLVPTRDSL